MDVETKKNSKIFHPFLIAFFPVIAIYSVNIGFIQLEEFILPTLLIVGSAFLFFLSLKYILKNGKKAALIVSLSFITFFSFGHVYNMLNQVSVGDTDLGSNLILLPIFTILFGIGSFLIIKTKATLGNATSIVNTMSVVFISVIVVMVGIETFGCDECLIQQTSARQVDFFSDDKIDFSPYFESHSFSISESDSLPNVYFIILDGYPRNDILEKHLNFDNSKFTNMLEQRGFHVAKNSFANYSFSGLSISSTMNMNYINFLADEIGEDSRDYNPIIGKDFGLYADNQVIKNFKLMGYKVGRIGTATIYLHEIPLADLSPCHKTVHLMDNRLLHAVGNTSMIGYFIERWAEEQQRQITLCDFEELPKISGYFEEPVFVWSHIMLPHFPLIFGPNGEPITPGQSLLTMNHPEYTGSGWDIKTQFVQQLQFSNKKSMEFIDKILENEKQSIIIIQSDHGSAFGVNLQDPTDDDAFQKLSNLSAIYFPDEKHREMLTDDRTNVNTFRLVFNSYFGSDYEMLEDRTYWGLSIKKPFWFKDVTSILLD
jgi:hypothetical protein